MLPTRFAVVVLCLMGVVWSAGARAQEAPGSEDGPMVHAPIVRQAPAAKEAQVPAAAQDTPMPMEPVVVYNKAIFQRLIPAAELTFLQQYVGGSSGDLYHDREFRHVVRGEVPGWMFHYGRDMPVQEALDAALESSRVPVQVREGRYYLLSGRASLYAGLQGRGFVWVDAQDGIVLAGFYFHPTNGEPTPTVTVFSRQVREDALTLGELPPAFAEDMRRWELGAGVPLVSTRYFIGDLKERVLLEHDEDFCSYLPGVSGPPDDDCLQQNADAADLDLNTAYYLEQVHHATNATAYMIVGDEQVSFISLRDRTCGRGPDPLACRIRLTRERVRGIVRPVRR
jgi:hypothetical protein